MRKLILLVTVIFCWNIGYSQKDEKAKGILQKVTKATQGYKSIKASFSYVMDNKEEDIHEEYKGEILLAGNKYHLNIPSLGMEMYTDGKTVWTYMKDANEVTVAEADDEMSDQLAPSKLFTIYEHGFSYQFVEDKTVDGKAVYVIDLFPENKEIEYSKIRIQIDKESLLIKRAEMVGKEGNNYIVQVEDLKTDVPTKDSDFVFDASKYNGVETVDLR